MRRPLEGIRVLDLTHVLAGPFCAYQLAVLGADVIKVEPPDMPDTVRGRGPDEALNAAGMGINYLAQGSNKRALALDLKREAGQALLLQLADAADVLIENYRTGALAALGVGAEVVRGRNPRLVYCSMTGFGQVGERAPVNAYDNVIQAACGLMDRTGGKARPIKTGASVIDYAAGYNAAFAIAAALLHRERTGEGQTIDCSMLDTALMLMAPELSAALHDGPKAKRPHEAGLGLYRTRDGMLMLGAFNPRQNARLWTALGRPDFASIGNWEGLWAQADAMRSALEAIMPTRTAAEWESFLHGIGVPAERVRTLDEAARMDQLAERGFLRELPSPIGGAPVRVPVAAFRYAQGGPAITAPAPRFGEHTDEILADLGLGAAEIRRLREEGVVA